MVIKLHYKLLDPMAGPTLDLVHLASRASEYWTDLGGMDSDGDGAGGDPAHQAKKRRVTRACDKCAVPLAPSPLLTHSN